MTRKPRYLASHIIAMHYCSDVADIAEARYQPSNYPNPAIYTVGDYYLAAPANNLPPNNMQGLWEQVGEYYGRKVFRMHMDTRET